MKIAKIFLFLSVFLLVFASKSFAQPDADSYLSIEDLRKKYPIDWLEEKFGRVSEENCIVYYDYAEEEETCASGPDFAIPQSWPCGIICEKYPQIKNCPSQCYSQDNLPKNLVCSFSKARFSDFSIDEIKSAFVRANLFLDKDNDCNQYEGNCNRIEEIVGLTYIYFLNTPSDFLTDDEKKLRNFVFSSKILTPRNDLVSSKKCNLFVEQKLASGISQAKQNYFCSNFFTIEHALRLDLSESVIKPVINRNSEELTSDDD